MDAIDSSIEGWLSTQNEKHVALEGSHTAFFKAPLHRTRSVLRLLESREPFEILFFSRRPEYFDVSDIESTSDGLIKSVTFCSNAQDLLALDRSFDIAITCTHAMSDHLPLVVMRARNLATLIVAWTWDNHHLLFENLCTNSLADIVMPAHAFCADLLKSPHYVLGKGFPLCTAQWSRELAQRLLTEEIHQPRSDALHGGYVMWKGGSRNEFLRSLQNDLEGHHISLIDDQNREAYFNLSAETRFREWMSHKVSLQIPYANDLSLRVFDSLLAGQIPIVPRDCYDLDAVVPTSLQESLPILRIGDLSAQTVSDAWKEGLRYFDQMATSGILRRHEFARDNHHISCRIRDIVDYIAKLRNDSRVELRIDDTGVGLAQIEASETSPAARLNVPHTPQGQLEAREADRPPRLDVIHTLQRQLELSEADRAARLDVIHKLQRQLDASEADRAARLEVIHTTQRQLEVSEADRAARLDVIHTLETQLAASETDRAARLDVIQTLQTQLENSQAERDRFQMQLRQIRSRADAMKLSRSWRLTRPLRWAARLLRK